jgi:hypothetical protein
LTSSKHIRLKRASQPARLTTVRQRSLKRDEFLKRDRQLSLRT